MGIINKLGDALSYKKRKKAERDIAASTAEYHRLRGMNVAKREAEREAKRQQAHAEKVRKYNDKTTSFGVGWGK
jgi:hypothetical protein